MVTNQLKQTLTEEEFNIVVRALRQNVILWRTLDETDLFEKVKRQTISGVSKWSPANLALNALNLTIQPTDLLNTRIHLNDEIKYKAATTLEKILSPGFSIQQDKELVAAGLAALAIRERWLLLENIEETFFEFIPENNHIWKLIISILFGMIPNQKDLLAFLMNSPNVSNHSLAVHGVMSQPMQIEEQAHILYSALVDQPSMQRSQTMRSIIQNYPVLAKYLASQLLEHLIKTQLNLQDPFQQLIHFVEKTELLKVTGRYEEVLPTLDQLNQTTTKMQADLTAQLAQAAARGKDQKTALEAIEKISELEKNIEYQNSTDITLAQINTGSLPSLSLVKNSENIETETKANLAGLLANSKMASQNGETKKAQNYAHLVYEATLKLFPTGENFDPDLTLVITPEFLQTLLETLLKVNLTIESVKIGQEAQLLFPNDPIIINLLANAYELIGDLKDATECAQIAHALAPEDKEIHQNLISLLTTGGQWVDARKEAEKLLRKTEKPDASDFTILANCYLQTDQITDAIMVCEKGLELYPEYWQLHQLLGKIYQRTQNYFAAQNHLSNAIIIDPQAVDPWLELAELHMANNEAEKALEKLLSASDVIPDNPKINLQLGILYAEDNDPIKALASFNQAARFTTPETDPEVQRTIDLHLGTTLFESNYFDEAITALEKAFKRYPTDAKIAHLYAKSLIKVKRFEDAFSPLTFAVQADQPTKETILDYAHLLLELSKSPELALEYINQVLKINPEDDRGKILQAMATAAADDHITAISLFQDALQTDLSRQPDYFTMLATGISDSAFKTSQPEVAITFLQEALRQIPDNTSLKKKLCQAFTHADLKHNALELLFEIRSTTNQKLEDQLWIADQAIALRELELAIETLDQANQISPQNAEIIVRLGYVQLENNQEEIARQTFGQLFDAENVDITDMKLAAHALIGLGDISSSIPYLEKALELCDYQSGDLLSELTKLHLKSGHFLAALDTINKHLQIEENQPSLWFQKSKILNKIGRPKAAIDSINRAIELSPLSAELHCKAAAMLRQNQALEGSLRHIQKALDLDSENDSLKIQAAEIFLACLRDAQAHSLITSLEGSKKDPAQLLKKAEILLEYPILENLLYAQKIIETSPEYVNSDPRGLAIQARMLALMGKEKQANQAFENALLKFSSFSFDDLDKQIKSGIELSIGEAALALNYWDIAIFMGREAEQTTPAEPRPYLFLVKTYTTRAEYQHTCKATQTFTHAPGDVALNSHAQESFITALAALYQHTPEPDEVDLIKKWEQRGNLALMNLSPEPNPILINADDFAALIAGIRRSGEKLTSDAAKDEWLDSDIVKFQLSLTFAKSQIHNAENIAGEITQTKSPSPIYLANHAFLANRTGNLEAALQSIRQALSIWPDEPRWHAFAAEMENMRGNHSQAIDHLEHASSLERDNPEHQYQLGKTYLLDHLPGNAIRVLQGAASLNLLEPKYWIALSKAYMNVSEFDQAMVSIEKAIKLSPNNVQPLILAAEIAYSNQETKKADRIIQDIIKMKPSNPEDIKSITEILTDRNKPREALQMLDHLIDYAVSPIPLILQKADILGKTKGLHEKIKLLVQLTLENPNNPQVLSQLAAAYIENQQPTEAIRAAQYALKNDDDALTIGERSKLHYQLGVLFQKSGQLDQSLHHLSEAVNLTPLFLEAYLDLAETLRQRREYSRAFSYLETATEIAPKDPRPFLAAGLLLKDGKDYTASESMLRKASALAPKDVFIQRQLAAVIALAIIHQSENA